MRPDKRMFVLMALGSYAIFLLYLLLTGTLKAYLNPKLAFLTVLALILIGAMLVYNLGALVAKKPDKNEQHCDCGHHHGDNRITAGNYLIFLPVVLAFLIAPQSLSYSADVRNLQPGSVVRAPNIEVVPPEASDSAYADRTTGKGEAVESIDSTLQTGEITQLDMGNLLFNPKKEMRRKLENAPIKLMGKVAQSPALAKNEVVLYRMVIACCVADGLPIGVLVKLPPGLKTTGEEWICVEGQVQLAPFEKRLATVTPLVNMVPPDRTFAFIVAAKAQKVTAPPEEYLYP